MKLIIFILTSTSLIFAGEGFTAQRGGFAPKLQLVNGEVRIHADVSWGGDGETEIREYADLKYVGSDVETVEEKAFRVKFQEALEYIWNAGIIILLQVVRFVM
jgi:hypothetical protein